MIITINDNLKLNVKSAILRGVLTDANGAYLKDEDGKDIKNTTVVELSEIPLEGVELNEAVVSAVKAQVE